MKTSRRDFLKQAGWTILGSGLLGAVVQLPARCASAASRPGGDLYGYIVDTTKCIGCGLCAGACRKENRVPEECYRTWIEHYTVYVDGRVEVESPHGGEKSFAPTEAKGKVDRSFFVPKLCNHCKEPNCVQVCPVGATYVSREGVVLVDQKQCVGLRLLHSGLPLRRAVHEPAAVCGGQVHMVLPPGAQRPEARLRDGLPGRSAAVRQAG